jgi:hypothetical protein
VTKSERAAQIWPLLALSAAKRQTLTYEEVGRLIGVPRQGLGQLLEPIQSVCILRDLPPLTVLVVSDVDGTPGPGFIGAQHVPSAQARHEDRGAASADFTALFKIGPSNRNVEKSWRRISTRRVEVEVRQWDSGVGVRDSPETLGRRKLLF